MAHSSHNAFQDNFLIVFIYESRHNYSDYNSFLRKYTTLFWEFWLLIF